MTEPTVVYVAGSPRSGSTLLARLLGSIDGWLAVGETRKLWPLLAKDPDHVCGCGSRVRECEVWGPTVDGVTGRFGAPDHLASLQWEVLAQRHSWRIGRASRSPAAARYAAVSSDLYRALARASGARVLVDTSKKPDAARFVCASTAVEARVLHLVRDVRGVIYSHRTRRDVPSTLAGMGDAAYRSASWLAVNAAAAAVRRRFGGHRLRYEDFTSDPVSEIARSVGLLAHQSGALRADGDRFAVPTNHIVHGNRNRFDSGSVRVQPDDRWAKGLSRGDRSVAISVAWPGLVAFGYVGRQASD